MRQRSSQQQTPSSVGQGVRLPILEAFTLRGARKPARSQANLLTCLLMQGMRTLYHSLYMSFMYVEQCWLARARRHTLLATAC